MTSILRSKLENHRGHTVLAFAKGSEPLVVDGGSHRGEFSTSVNAAWGARCHSIEASPALFPKLDLPKSAVAHHFAVSGTDGTITFAISDNPEASHVVDGAPAADEAGQVTVPARSLGNFLTEVAPDGLDLLKLDVEGAEIAALASVTDEQLARIAQITVEFHNFCGYVTVEEVERTIERLRALDFEVFNFAYYVHTDVLFVNRRLVKLSAWDRFRIGVWYRLSRGVGRVIARRLKL